jgi:DNA repair exonuclease SbcCD ATPase subunit
MIKIDSVEIINFMSHKNTIIYTDSDLNVLIGPSDSGKSAILRLIKWCLWNTPDGTDFIRQGETYAEGILRFNDGKVLRRRKGKKENLYELINADGTSLTLEAFGTGSVPEVIAFHGMREVSFFGKKQSLNYCDQFAMPFFLANTSAERATMIGELAKTDVVDLAVKNLASEIREKKITLKTYKEQLKENEEKLLAYKDLPRIEVELARMKALIDDITTKTGIVEKVLELKSNIICNMAKKIHAEETIAKKMELDIAINGVEHLILLNTKLSQIRKTKETLLVNLQRKEDLERIINQTSVCEIDAAIKSVEELVSKIRIAVDVKSIGSKILLNNARIDTLKSQAEDVKKLGDIDSAIKDIELQQTKLTDYAKARTAIDNIKATIERRKKGDVMIQSLKEKYNVAYVAYEEAITQSGTCPFCMSPVSKEKIREVV